MIRKKSFLAAAEGVVEGDEGADVAVAGFEQREFGFQKGLAGGQDLKVSRAGVPHEEFGLTDILRQFFESMQTCRFRYRERFLLPYRDGYRTVRVSDINHIVTENKVVHLRLNDGTSESVGMSMDEIEQQLDPDRFFRANRQCIINIEQITFLSNHFGGKLIVQLKGYPKAEIQVSREKAQRLKDWIDR